MVLSTLALLGAALAAQPETTIVGSGTVAPLAEVVASKVNAELTAGSVVIEPTGSNKGFELFCAADDPSYAPMTLASRQFSEAELASCSAALGAEVTETELGINVLTLVANRRGPLASINLTRADLFRAFAVSVPSTDGSCELVPNTAKRWNDVRADLPDLPIDAFGPGTSSGTYSSFIDLVMIPGAKADPCMRRLDADQPGTLKKTAKALRFGDVWHEAPEDDVEVVAHLHHNEHVVSVVGFTAATRFGRHVAILKVEGETPSPDSFAARSYDLIGKLYLYTNEKAVASNDVAAALRRALTDETAIGEDGYLIRYGLIPLVGGAR